jgi:hypothetical protein
MSPLLPCPHCSRHHRVCEPVCPFCGGALPECKAAPSQSSRSRMSRATLFAAGAALLGGAACDDGSSMKVSVVVHYGAPGMPVFLDAGTDAAASGEAKTSDAGTPDDGKAARAATDSGGENP